MNADSNKNILQDLQKKGYFLLPLPFKKKDPPPIGWITHDKPYTVKPGQNMAIGTRGELAILITNDDTSTDWATKEFGRSRIHCVSVLLLSYPLRFLTHLIYPTP
jgi:hypothetical protein